MSNTPAGKTSSIPLTEGSHCAAARVMLGSILAAAMLFFTVSCLSAQAPEAVPVPSQLATAHTAFLAYAGAPGLDAKEILTMGMTYSTVYHALANSGQFHLLPAPANAELSMEISTPVIDGQSVTSSAHLRLAIYDTKTHSLLWVIEEPLQGAYREKTFQRNLDDATARVIADLKTLAAGNIPGYKPSPQKSATAPPIHATPPCIRQKQPKTRITQEDQEKK